MFIGIVRKKYYLETLTNKQKSGQFYLKKEHGFVCYLFFKTEITNENTPMVSCNNNTEFINSFKRRFESTGMLLERSDLKITGDLGQGMYLLYCHLMDLIIIVHKMLCK